MEELSSLAEEWAERHHQAWSQMLGMEGEQEELDRYRSPPPHTKEGQEEVDGGGEGGRSKHGGGR